MHDFSKRVRKIASVKIQFLEYRLVSCLTSYLFTVVILHSNHLLKTKSLNSYQTRRLNNSEKVFDKIYMSKKASISKEEDG